MKNLLIPKRLLEWINSHRDTKSQQAFIIDVLMISMFKCKCDKFKKDYNKCD